jgi:hypothetical protein
MILRAMGSNIHSLFHSERSIQMIFSINGTMWQVQCKNSNSGELKRSDNVSVLGVTDRNTHTIYLSNVLRGFMQRKVLIHEVCHAICMSYDVYLPIEQEEILCDFVATYGDEVFDIVDMVLGAVRRVG